MIQVRWAAGLAAAAAGLAIAASASAGGVTGPAFYVDGELYRTVGTPTDFSDTGAPEHSFDTIYAFPMGTQDHNVAEAKPGDADFNGGRWMVKALTFTTSYDDALAAHDSNGSGTFDSAEEVEAALAAGDATATEVRRFECPVIPVPPGRS